MKLSLEALRTRQRLLIRVPASPAILRQCFTNWLFRNLGAFQESSSATFLLPIREGLPVIHPESVRMTRASIQRVAGVAGLISAQCSSGRLGRVSHRLRHQLSQTITGYNLATYALGSGNEARIL